VDRQSRGFLLAGISAPSPYLVKGAGSSGPGSVVYCVDRQVLGFLLAEISAPSSYLGQEASEEWVW